MLDLWNERVFVHKRAQAGRRLCSALLGGGANRRLIAAQAQGHIATGCAVLLLLASVFLK
jgi:hypothetical protein